MERKSQTTEIKKVWEIPALIEINKKSILGVVISITTGDALSLIT